jgi:ribosome-associated heat shock protein Hsp15
VHDRRNCPAISVAFRRPGRFPAFSPARSAPVRLVPIMSIPSSSPANVRVDAWLWAIRAYKTRSAATAACRAGHIRVNGNPVKASQSVIIGDTIRVRESGWERILEVRRLIAKRVGAEAASHCFTDHTPPRPVAPKLGLPQRDRGAGRPTKKDRRDMEKLRG